MLTYAIPCIFGLESLIREELHTLELQEIRAEDGRVFCRGEVADIARLNLNIRYGERVLVLMGTFPANDFEALYQGALAAPWEDFIPREGCFPVKGYSLHSTLHSIPDCQRIVKKAAAVRLSQKYHVVRMPEAGAVYQIQFGLLKNQCSLYLDTTGAALHKRGYRAASADAPLRETLAAALVRFARFRGKNPFRDPFCGSGTIAIEAALIAKNRAPGLGRRFSAQAWECVDSHSWKDAAEEAVDKEFHGAYDIWGGDINPQALKIARQNAALAGVNDCVRFEAADMAQLRSESMYGQLVTNPPYGERIRPDDLEGLYRQFADVCAHLPEKWRILILSGCPDFEHYFGRKAARRRNLYNGGIRCVAYHYGAR